MNESLIMMRTRCQCLKHNLHEPDSTLHGQDVISCLSEESIQPCRRIGVWDQSLQGFHPSLDPIAAHSCTLLEASPCPPLL